MPNGDERVDRSAELEEKTYELGGIKTLISRNHYTAERFWSIYDEANYRRRRRASTRPACSGTCTRSSTASAEPTPRIA